MKATLIRDEHGLGITGLEGGKPIYVDFNNRQISYRRKSSGAELIARAVGIKKLKSPVVVDATAGLGLDSFMLATLGCQVHMIERSKVIAALLADGLERGRQDKEIMHIIQRMQLHRGDAIELLKGFTPEVVYLDPMFSGKANNALVKKEMRIFREVVGDDEDAAELLRVALLQAKYRVVVKRLRKAPPIADIKPTYKLEGSACRFDVYQIASSFS